MLNNYFSNSDIIGTLFFIVLYFYLMSLIKKDKEYNRKLREEYRKKEGLSQN